MKIKDCFVIMPISDNENYDVGHFDRVYEYLIKPAVIEAGFNPVRADDIKKTNYIIIDILKKLVDSEMALCDLSSSNPNVLYELGIRQSFNKPVTFIKDNLTERIFDIQGFRDFEYDASLRIDSVEKERVKLAEVIANTYNSSGKDINSIIDLLSIKKATLDNELKISPELSVILKSIENIDNKLSKLQYSQSHETLDRMEIPIADPNILKIGDEVIHQRFGKGTIVDISGSASDLKGTVKFDEYGMKYFLLRFAKLGLINNNKAK